MQAASVQTRGTALLGQAVLPHGGVEARLHQLQLGEPTAQLLSRVMRTLIYTFEHGLTRHTESSSHAII